MSSGRNKAAQGERSALIGIIPQYELCAREVFRSLQEGDFEWVEIQSEDADKVDDYVVSTNQTVLAAQVKNSDAPKNWTLAAIAKPLKTTAKGVASSLFLEQFNAWVKLSEIHAPKVVRVKLTIGGYPATVGKLNDQLSQDETKLHLSNFLKEVWGRLKDKAFVVNESDRWCQIYNELVEITGGDEDVFRKFAEHSIIEFDQGLSSLSVEKDKGEVQELRNFLLSYGGADQKPERLTRSTLLTKLRWQSRYQSKFNHEFYVDPQYQPIGNTITYLTDKINEIGSGYMALIGAPGSGKSTTLTKCLGKMKRCRLVSYYAYLPDNDRDSRGEANVLLHDLILALNRMGISGQLGYAPRDPIALECEFYEQLNECHEKWQTEGVKTVIFIDGLDHIDREYEVTKTLLKALPKPSLLKEGVVIILGTQTVHLQGMHRAVAKQLGTEGRIYRIDPFNEDESRLYLKKRDVLEELSSIQFSKFYELTEGHPLATKTLCNLIERASDKKDLNRILGSIAPLSEGIDQWYNDLWDSLADDPQDRRLFGLIARVRDKVNLSIFNRSYPESFQDQFKCKYSAYLDISTDYSCKFFHNSFRQFVLKQTGESEEDHQNIHKEICDHLLQSDDENAKYDLIYHLYKSNNPSKLLKIATPSFFFKQFHRFRPIDCIYEDVKLCTRVAVAENNPLKLIEYTLMCRKLQIDAQSLDDSSVAKAIYYALGVNSYFEYTKHSNVVHTTDTLELAIEQLNSGKKDDCWALFSQSVDPSVLEGHRETTFNPNLGDSDIILWVSIAWCFRPIDDIVQCIQNIQFAPNGFDLGRSATQHARKAKNDCMIQLGKSLIDFDQPDKLQELYAISEKLGGVENFEYELDKHLCQTQPTSNKSRDILPSLDERVRRRLNGSLFPLQYVQLRWDILADKQDLIRYFTETERLADIDSPSSYTAFRSEVESWIKYARLAKFAGINLDEELSSKSRDDYGVLQNWIVKIVNLAPTDSTYNGGSIFTNLTSNLLRYFDFKGSYDHVQRQIKECTVSVFKLLLDVAHENGVEQFKAVEKRLLVRFNERYWFPWGDEAIRNIAFYMEDLDPDPARLEAILTKLDDNYEHSEETHTRIEFFKNQSLAWSKFGNQHKAQKSLSEITSQVAGIERYKEKSDIGGYVNVFSKVLDGDFDKDYSSDIETVTNLFTKIGEFGKNEDHINPLITFLEALARNSPAYATRICFYLYQEGDITWEVFAESQLCILLQCEVVEFDVVNAFLINSYIPWASREGSMLPLKYFKSLERVDGSEQNSPHLLEVRECVAKYAPPCIKEKWMTEMGTSEVPLKENVLDESLGTNEDSLQEVIEQLDSIQSLPSYEQPDPISKLVTSLPKSTLDQLANHALDRPTYNISIVVKIAEECGRKNLQNLAQKLCEANLHLCGKPEWGETCKKSLWGRLSTLLLSCEDSERTRKVLLIAWGEIISQTSPMIRDFSDIEYITKTLFSVVPWNELWGIYRQILQQTSEYHHSKEGFKLSSSGEETIDTSELVISWLIEQYDLGGNSLQDWAVRGCLSLIKKGKLTLYELYKNLDESKLSHQEMWLLVAECVGEKNSEKLAPVRTTIENLLASPSMITRLSAENLLSMLGVVADIKQERDLSMAYNLDLPSIEAPHFRMAHRDVGETIIAEDGGIEQIRCIEYQLRELSVFSGIDFTNLVTKCVEYMAHIAISDPWNIEAEGAMTAMMKQVDIRVPWTKPNALACHRALSMVLADLYDANLIDKNVVEYAVIPVKRWDAKGLEIPIESRPSGISSNIQASELRERDYGSTPSNNPWEDFEISENELLIDFDEGWHVLAEHRFTYGWERHSPKEVVRSSLSIEPIRSSKDGVMAHDLQRWHMNEYPMLLSCEQEPHFCVLLENISMIGRYKLIAPNPAMCASLGLKHEGGFNWSKDNELILKAINWQDSGQPRVGVYDSHGVSSKGSIVLITSNGLNLLRSYLSSDLHFNVIKTRSIHEHSRDCERESKSVYKSRLIE